MSDLADAHVLGLEYLRQGGVTEAFNLGNGNGFSVKEVIEAARKITAKEIKAIATDRRPGDPPSLVGSSEKARTVLGWQPQYADLETICNTLGTGTNSVMVNLAVRKIGDRPAETPEF